MTSFPQASPPLPCAQLYPPSYPIRATCPVHLIRLNFTTRTILGKEYRSFSSSLCSFLHSPVTSSLLGPNTFLNTLFSNTLSPRSSLNVSDQVSHTYKTTGKIIVLYIQEHHYCIKFIQYWSYYIEKLSFNAFISHGITCYLLKFSQLKLQHIHSTPSETRECLNYKALRDQLIQWQVKCLTS